MADRRSAQRITKKTPPEDGEPALGKSALEGEAASSGDGTTVVYLSKKHMEDVRTHSAKFVRVPAKWFTKVFADQRLTFQENPRYAKTTPIRVVAEVLKKGRLTKSMEVPGNTTGIGPTILQVQYAASAIQPQDGDWEDVPEDLEDLFM